MNILVIGGTRFIGLAGVKRLVELGHTVAVFSRGQTQADLPEGVQRITGDMATLTDHRAAFEAFAPEVVWHNMVIGEADARALIEAFRGIARRAVMVSSMDVYLPYNYLFGREKGDPVAYPMNEDSPLRTVLYPYQAMLQDQNHPRWWYDKIPAERLVMESADLPGTVLRLPMVYGENDFQRRLTPFLKPMIDGRPGIVMSEGAAAWRSTYGYIANVAEAVVRAITDDRAMGRIYNIGETTLSSLGLAQKVKEAVGWSGEFVIVPDADLPEALREPYDYSAHLDNSDARIRRELDFTPSVPLDESIRRTVVWERDHLDPEANYAEMYGYAAQDEVLNRSARSAQ